MSAPPIAPPDADRFTWGEFRIIKPVPPKPKPKDDADKKALTYREKLAFLLGDVEGHPFRGNQWTDGEGGGGGRDRTESPRFKAWFKESKVVDDEGQPLVVYHGTTHDIEEFKKAGDEGLNPESDWGAGVYFTSEPEDAGENYAGEGPDLTARIEHEVDRLQSENEDLSHDDALKQARAALAGKSVAIYPAYVSMQQPFVVGDANGTSSHRETVLTSEYVYDDPNDSDSDIVGQEGTLPDFLAALRDEASQHSGGDEAVEKFTEKIMDRDMITASELVKAWNDTEEASYIESDTGALVNKEVFRAALERAGFDGVIDREVDTKFGSQRRIGQSMKGMNPDTTHFVVFAPTQIKSATGNTTFDPANPKITMSAHGRRRLILLGDVEGHPFRGNQWTDGDGESARPAQREMEKREAALKDATLRYADALAAHSAVVKAIKAEHGGDLDVYDPTYYPSLDARNEAAQAEHAARLAVEAHAPVVRQETVQIITNTVSTRQGFDAGRIDVVDIEPRGFTVAGRQLNEGGHYDPGTGRIEVNSRNLARNPEFTQGLVSHEIMHAQHDTVRIVAAKEHDEISKLASQGQRVFGDGGKVVQDATPEWDRLFGRNGYPRESRMAEIEARWPASAAMARTAPLGDPYLGTWKTAEDGKTVMDDRGLSERGHAMRKDDGFTAYSRLYWEAYETAMRDGPPNAIGPAWKRAEEETLAEVAAYHEQAPRGPWKEGVPAKSWQDYALQLRKTYPKVKAQHTP